MFGRSFVSNMSQTMVSISNKQVVEASLVNTWIWYPSIKERRKISITERWKCTGINYIYSYSCNIWKHIMGAIDGTHIAKIKPLTANTVDRGFQRRWGKHREKLRKSPAHSLANKLYVVEQINKWIMEFIFNSYFKQMRYVILGW